MKVLYLANVPAPYMVNYFNELGRLCDLTVLFEKATSAERDTSWQNYTFVNFKGVILSGISTAPDAAFCPEIIRYLKKGVYDYIVAYNMATPTGILAIEYMKMRKISFYLESEGGFAKDGKGAKELFKKQLMTGAKGYFSTASAGDAYFIQYGAQPELIYKYPFTSLYEKDILTAPLSPLEKQKIRAELGISEKRCVLTVGQFIYRKGFDILLEAARTLDQDTCVCFVGGIPTEEYLDYVQRYALKNVRFIGFKSSADLRQYYLASDLFVLPTREDIWGLVINEAMACALPIITTDRCIAGLELVDDSNGRIIPSENADALAYAIHELLALTDLHSMGVQSLKHIQWYTFESMAKVHMDFFIDHLHSTQ